MISIILLLGIFFCILGIIVGSFLNVVILRYNTGMGLEGRSQCFSCGKQLVWYELIPVFSFLFLRGKCSRCNSRISWQYPLVELATGITFVALFAQVRPYIQLSFASFIVMFALYIGMFSTLIIIFVYDLRHKIIPDGLVIIFGALGLLTTVLQPFPLAFHIPTFFNLLAGPLLAAPFAFLWLVSKGTWMGLGDAKLALGIGWTLGIIGGLSAIILAFWVGAVISIVILAVQKAQVSFRKSRFTLKSEIPFAPFLIIGFALIFFFQIAIPGISQIAQLTW